MNDGLTPTDNRGVPVLSLWSDVLNQAIPVYIGALQTGADGNQYAQLAMKVENANANGQSTMANSAPVAIASDQTAIPTKGTDTFGVSSNITAATTFTGIPTVPQLVANSFVVLINPGGQATFITELNVASAFVGTLSFYGMEPDSTILQPINAHQRNTATVTISNASSISTAAALNQTWVGNCAGFKSIYMVCTAFTSGSITVQTGLSSAPYGVMILNNPTVIEGNIGNWIRAGNGLVYFNPQSATATNGGLVVCALSIFNPSSVKNILIYSVQVSCNGGAPIGGQLRLTTVDPSGTAGFTGSATGLNLKPGGSATVASLSASATGITASPASPGSLIGLHGIAASAPNELLTNGAEILLPAGAANGLAVMVYVNSAGNNYQCVAKGIEY